MSKEREAFETWLFSTEKFKFRNKNFLFMLDEYGNYEDKPVLEHWGTWQAAKAQEVPEGFVLVPVETLNEALSWANCASNESWSDAQREEIYKHYEVIEKAMIEAQQPASTSDCPDEP